MRSSAIPRCLLFFTSSLEQLRNSGIRTHLQPATLPERAQHRTGRTIFLRRRCPGLIQVSNESHENPEKYQYTVAIDDVTDELMACTCPHHVHRNAFCKHMAAVETATNDGTLDAFPSEDENAESEDCDCDGLSGFPCWPCVRAGRKELPN